MDWKRYYAEELGQPWGRKAAWDAVTRHAGGDRALQAALRAGAWVSFPHVTLRDSAEPLARLAQSIIESGKKRVVALGVLHGGTLPAAYRDAWAALSAESSQAQAVFPRFAGAFFVRGAAATPFGPVDEGALPMQTESVREDAAILEAEFSLDLFLALLAAAAQLRGVRPPAVTRLFVGAVRSPGGSFQLAQTLAREIGALVDEDTACVATGDLAHLGHGYTAASDVAALPDDRRALEAVVRASIDEQCDAALTRGDFAAAWAVGTRWRNDQRHMLPVIAELVGPKARFELLSLDLSDYSQINGVQPPCFVASALGVFHRTPALTPP